MVSITVKGSVYPDSTLTLKWSFKPECTIRLDSACVLIGVYCDIFLSVTIICLQCTRLEEALWSASYFKPTNGYLPNTSFHHLLLACCVEPTVLWREFLFCWFSSKKKCSNLVNKLKSPDLGSNLLVTLPYYRSAVRRSAGWIYRKLQLCISLYRL